MSTLYERIITYDQRGPMPGYHPYGTAQTAMIGPLARVEYDGENMIYDDLHPLYAAGPESAPIPATGPGAWDQVVGAGRR